LPAQPAWLLRLPAIRAAVSAVSVAVLDRASIEAIFRVRRRRAIELLHRFGGYQAGKTFLVDRNALLRQLEMLEAGAAFGQEKARRRRVSEEIDQAKAVLRGRAISIPPVDSVAGVPEGARLRAGELRIAFDDSEDLLRQLLELAMVIRNDYEGFDRMYGARAKRDLKD
jgi:hypothetical protein